MLKITTVSQNEMIHFLLEGRLTASTMSVLERCWREAQELLAPMQIHVELMDVTYVDSVAKALLRQMAASGVRFTANGIEMKAVVEEVTKEAI